MAANFEVAGDDEAVAGVVAFAAEDDDRAVDAEPLEHVDAAAAGVFHQHQAGDAVLFDRAAIEFAALVAGEGDGVMPSALASAATPASIRRCADAKSALTLDHVTTRTFRRRG